MHCMRISHKLACNPVTAPKSYFCSPHRSNLSATVDLRLALSTNGCLSREQRTSFPRSGFFLKTIAQLRSNFVLSAKRSSSEKNCSPRLSTRLYFAMRHPSLTRVEAYVNCRGLKNSNSDAQSKMSQMKYIDRVKQNKNW